MTGRDPLALVRALAEQVDPQAFHGEWVSEDTQQEYRNRALHFAAKAIDLGWRPVVVDDTTVERVAAAIDDAVRASWGGNPADFVSAPEDWAVAARAAVRAVLGEDQP